MKFGLNHWALTFASIGALNWLLVAFANMNLVESLTTAVGYPALGTFIYSLVGVSGIWIGIKALTGKVSIK